MALREVVKLIVEGEDKASKELKKAEAATFNLEGAVKRFGAFMKSPAGIAAVVTGATFALKKFAEATAKQTDVLGKFSTRIGVSVTDVSELAFVADRAGVAQNTLLMALQRGQRRLEEFAKGTGEAKNTLEEFGFTSESMAASGQTIIDLLPMLAAKFQALSAEGRGAAEAMKLFDSEGVSLLQFLREGPEAMEALRQKARDLGVTISEGDARAAAAFTDASTNLKSALIGLRNEAITPLLPFLAQLADSMASVVGAVTTTADATSEWSKTIDDFDAEKLKKIYDAIQVYQYPTLPGAGARPRGGVIPRPPVQYPPAAGFTGPNIDPSLLVTRNIEASVLARTGFPAQIADAQAAFLASTQVQMPNADIQELPKFAADLNPALDEARQNTRLMAVQLLHAAAAARSFIQSLASGGDGASLGGFLGFAGALIATVVPGGQAAGAVVAGAGAVIGRQPANNRRLRSAQRRAATLGGV